MKFNFSIKTLAIASVMSLGLLAPVHADDDETPLGEQMDVLSGSLKKLRKAETAAEKVELVHSAQKATLKSLEFSPMIFKDIKDEKEKAKATADYKRLIGLTYAKLCELEMAYLAGDEEKADAIKGELKDLKKDGHEKYTD
jgi:DNA-binding transcriptional regulator LsrR (DeoR family)